MPSVREPPRPPVAAVPATCTHSCSSSASLAVQPERGDIFLRTFARASEAPWSPPVVLFTLKACLHKYRHCCASLSLCLTTVCRILSPHCQLYTSEFLSSKPPFNLQHTACGASCSSVFVCSPLILYHFQYSIYHIHFSFIISLLYMG